jgi:hypothetical protein
MADQYWLRVTGYLQPPPAREVLTASGYYHGDDREAMLMPAGRVQLPPVPAPAPAPRPRSAAVAPRAREISRGDRLIYFGLGPFSLYAVGTVTSDPEPHPTDPTRKIVEVKTDIFINQVLKTPHFGGIALPSGRDLRVVVQRYNYIWLSPEDGEALIERVHTKAGAKD